MTVVGNLRTRNADSVAGNLQHRARARIHALQVDGRQSRNRMPHVFDARLRDAKRQGFRKRLWTVLGHGVTDQFLLRTYQVRSLPRLQCDAASLPLRPRHHGA